jgi:hypothetical protein
MSITDQIKKTLGDVKAQVGEKLKEQANEIAEQAGKSLQDAVQDLETEASDAIGKKEGEVLSGLKDKISDTIKSKA